MALYEPPFRKSPLEGKDRFKIPEKDVYELGEKKEPLEESTLKKETKKAFKELSRLWIPTKKKEEPQKKITSKNKKVKETKEYPGIFKTLKSKKWGSQTYFSRIDMRRKMKNDPYFRHEVFKKANIIANPEKKKQILGNFYERLSEIKKKKFRSGAPNIITEKEIGSFAKEFKKLRQYGKKEDKMLGNLGKVIFGEPKK